MIPIEEYIKSKVRETLKKLSIKEKIDINIEKPKNDKFGDFTINTAMQLAKVLKRSPRDIASDIVKNIDDDKGYFEKIEIAGPGFINFYIKNEYFYQFLDYIFNYNVNEFFKYEYYKNHKVNVEFVSANPTGPLNVVSGRAAAVGDSVCRLIERGSAQKVDREFYINDAGNQVKLLGLSLRARYAQLLGYDEEVPEDGYHGEYLKDIAKAFLEKYGKDFDWRDEKNLDIFINFALEYNINWQKRSLEQYGVKFDIWFSEKKLRESGLVDEVLNRLIELGYTYEKDGAIWFKATEFGDEKDRVLVTKDKRPTYFLPDIAYHVNKASRGYDWFLVFWGPDHHGYFPRLWGALDALGYDRNRFDFRIVQQVNLLRGGKQVKMSKRTGEIITLDELLEEVGKDAAKFFFLMRSSNSHLDFDIEVAKKQTDENPVFYIQYAHARICSILRNIDEDIKDIDIDWSLLKEPGEIKLIKKIYQYNEILNLAVKNLEPHRINDYLIELAGEFHNFYHHYRVITEPKELSKARYGLIEVVKKVIKDGLDILGIDAPERM